MAIVGVPVVVVIVFTLPFCQLSKYRKMPFRAHGVSTVALELARDAMTGRFEVLADVGHVAVLVGCVVAGAFFGVRTFTRRLSA